MLTPDMQRIIREQRLGFVATAAPDGTPNVSPKGTFIVLDDQTIAFGEIRSPGTIRNLRGTLASKSTLSTLSCARAIVLPARPRSWSAGSRYFDALLCRFQSPLGAAHASHSDDQSDEGAAPDITCL